MLFRTFSFQNFCILESVHSARHRSSELGPKGATPLLHKKGNQGNEGRDGKDGRSLGHVAVKTVEEGVFDTGQR